MHVHVPRQPGLPPLRVQPGMQKFFKVDTLPKDAKELASDYRKWDILGVIYSLGDTESNTGELPDTNDYIATIVRDYPEQFIGFATVDPWKNRAAVIELERAITTLGLKGLKLHPIQQGFYPNDERFYPLYEKCSSLAIPVLFHSGFAAAGLGAPGGLGLKLKYGAPIPGIDDVAADFPDLTIIMAHPSWPWIEEQIAVTLHKANVYIDLSGWSPKYIPETLIHETNTRLSNKVLFGSDYPYLTPERWLREFDELHIKPEVKRKVLLDNARKVLGLGELDKG